MDLAKLCREFMVNHAVPRLERLVDASGLSEESKKYNAAVTAWNEEHRKVLQDWGNQDMKRKANTLSFIAQCCAEMIPNPKGGQQLYPQLYFDSLLHVLEQICDALPSDDGYFWKIRRCCLAFFKDCLRHSQAALKVLNRHSIHILDPNPRAELFEILKVLEGHTHKWQCIIKGTKGTHEWSDGLGLAWHTWVCTIRNMCLSLHPLNPGSVKTKPEEVTTNLEVLRLQTPKVIAYVLYDLMTGVENDTLFYEVGKVQSTLDALPSATKEFSHFFTGAGLTEPMSRMTKDVVAVLAHSWGNGGPTKDLPKGLQKALEAISHDFLTEGKKDAGVVSSQTSRLEGQAGSQPYQLGSAKDQEKEKMNDNTKERQTLLAEPQAEQEGGALESSLKKSAGIIQSAALGPSPNFENAEGVERDVLAHEERARPSIRNLWDVKDAKTLLADYINNITAHLEKHGVRRIQAHEAIHAFLRALPGIQETGILLSYGQLPPNGIVSIMGADSEGALAGNPLHTLIQDLERETQERGAEHCHGVTCGSIVRDMRSFYETFQSRGQHVDPAAPDHCPHLQDMGYALLDMAKSGCHLMEALLRDE